jgi:hypothetical protein
MQKLLRVGRKPLGSRVLALKIAELGQHAELKRPPPTSTLREKLAAESALEEERRVLHAEETWKEEMARKCTSFWWNLEQHFLKEEKSAPSSSLALLRWFWRDKGEFVEAYRRRVGAHALPYL